jgi:Tfp pilus assembly protein PilF
LRQKFFLIGDGNLIIRIINSQRLDNVDATVFKNEPLSGYIMIKLSKLIAAIVPALPEEYPIQMAVISMAVICLILSWQLVRTISENRTERILLCGSIVSAGTLQLLFGYIGAYIPFYCGLLLFIIFSLRYLKGESSLELSASAFGILFCLHFGALFFSPVLCFLFFHNMRTAKGRHVPAAVICMILVSVLILWFLEYPLQKFTALFSNSAKHLLLMDFSSPATDDIGFFSIHHVINIINFLILMGVFYIGSLFLPLTQRSVEKSDRSRLFLIFPLGIMGILFVIFFRSEIGMSRDWDIFAVFYSGFIITAATYTIKFLYSTVIYRRLAIMMVGITVLQSFSFVLVNSNEVWARNRFENLPDSKLWPSSGMTSAYEELSIYYRGRKEPHNALRYLSLLHDIDSTNPRIYRSIAHIYMLMNDKRKEIEYLNRAHALSPNDWEVCLNLGSSYGAIGKYDSAVVLLQKALALQPKSPLVIYTLGIATLKLTDNCARASQYFNLALEFDPGFAVAYAGLALCADKQNDLVLARAYIQKYLQLKSNNDLLPEVREMLNRIY